MEIDFTPLAGSHLMGSNYYTWPQKLLISVGLEFYYLTGGYWFQHNPLRNRTPSAWMKFCGKFWRHQQPSIRVEHHKLPLPWWKLPGNAIDSLIRVRIKLWKWEQTISCAWKLSQEEQNSRSPVGVESPCKSWLWRKGVAMCHFGYSRISEKIRVGGLYILWLH